MRGMNERVVMDERVEEMEIRFVRWYGDGLGWKGR